VIGGDMTAVAREASSLRPEGSCVINALRMVLLLAAEEGRDVRGEVRVVLEQEPVGGVGVDLDAGLRDQAGEQMG
jgi:hypothetical protein